MSFYQIDSRQLRSKRDELIGLSRRFVQAKEELCARESALKSMWEGAANDSFHALFMKNAGQMDAFIEVVNQYMNVIESVADRYDMAEMRNLGRVI